MRSVPGLKRMLALGYVVFGGLIVIKIVEYFIGSRMKSGGWVYLTVLSIAASWLILRFFMHIQQLKSGKRNHD